MTWSTSLPGRGQAPGRRTPTFRPRRSPRLPQVTALAPVATYTVLEPAAATLGVPLNGAIPGTFWHRKLLAGRLPDARQPDEVDVSFTVTQASPHLQVGDTLPLLLLGAKGEPVRVNLRVVGIEAAPAEIPPQYGPGVDFIWATPAFVRAYGARLLDTPGSAVRLRHGAADVPALEREIRPDGRGKFVNDYPLGPQAANTDIGSTSRRSRCRCSPGCSRCWGCSSSASCTHADRRRPGGLRHAAGLGVVPRQLAAAALARAALMAARRGARGGHGGRHLAGVPCRTGGDRRAVPRHRRGLDGAAARAGRSAGCHGRRRRVAGLGGSAGRAGAAGETGRREGLSPGGSFLVVGLAPALRLAPASALAGDARLYGLASDRSSPTSVGHVHSAPARSIAARPAA